MNDDCTTFELFISLDGFSFVTFFTHYGQFTAPIVEPLLDTNLSLVEVNRRINAIAGLL